MHLDLQRYRNRHSFASKFARGVWNVVWFMLARWTPDRIAVFNCWRILLLRIFRAKIGRHCVVMSSCSIWQPWNLQLGNWVALSEMVNCYSVAPIAIGDNATVSREAFLCTASHDISSPTMELTFAPIEIGCNAWIAARAIVLPGRKIGEGAVVAAGSVVVNNVDPWTVVGGNPAHYLSNRVLDEVLV